jgi:hypothetical protein
VTDTAVPGPEPDWWDAPASQPGNPNPAFQQGMWWYAARNYPIIAGLRPPLEALAARLRLRIEHSWEDLGDVKVAMFQIGGTHFALSQFEVNEVHVSLSPAVDDTEAALDVLLHALGIGRDALTFHGTAEHGFVRPDGTPLD